MVKLKDFGVTRESGLLENGSRLTVFRKSSSPIFTRFAFLSGGRFDPVGKEGLAHFMEHMLTAGTKTFPSKDKLAEYLENFGGEFGASTDNEAVYLNIEVADKIDFGVVAEIANEMINDSLFLKKTVETERGSIHSEINDWKSNPSRYIGELWRKLFFQKTDMGRFVLGTHKTLDKITSNDLTGFASNRLVSSNLAVIVSGDVTFTEAKKIIEKHLYVKKTSVNKKRNTLPVYRDKNILIEKNEEKQVHYILGFRTVSEFDYDYEILSLISTILGGSRASILNKKLRYEKGLVYSVYTDNKGLSDAGSFFVKTSTSKKDLNETISIILNEFNKVKSRGFSKKKLEFAKNKIWKSKKRTMQTSGSWVNFHTLGELINPEEYLKLDDYVNKILKIRNSDIIEVANKYFKKNSWYLAAVGNIEENDVKINF